MKTRDQFKFDVALSFAGPDRKTVELVARELKRLRIRFFYDKDRAADLWGKNQKVFEQIYGPDSVFVVPFISKDYVDRDWPQFEFETARREMKRRQTDFLLPVRLDDTRQFGLREDHQYLAISQYGPKQIAAAVKKKLDDIYAPEDEKGQRRTAIPLTASARIALGIIAAAPLPMHGSHLRQFFPDISWSTHLRAFLNQSLVTKSDQTLKTPTAVKKMFIEELPSLRGRWKAALEEHKGHIDCAFLLALLHMQDRKIDLAIETIGPVVLASDPTSWLDLCTTMLQSFNQKRLLAALPVETRCLFHFSLGVGLTSAGRVDESRVQFESLRDLAASHDNIESFCLALLNIGIAHHKSSDDSLAAESYLETLRLAKKHRLHAIASHALMNLGQLSLSSDPSKAIHYLNEAAEYKRRIRDYDGQAAVHHSLATALAELELFADASSEYSKAERIADKRDLPYLKTLIRFNRALMFEEIGQLTEAVRMLKSCSNLASAEGYQEMEARSYEALARIHFERSRPDLAEPFFAKLADLAESPSLVSYKLTGLHGLWLAHTLKGEAASARRHLRTGLSLARRFQSAGWIAKLLADDTRRLGVDGLGPVSPTRLHKRISRESATTPPETRCKIWLMSIGFLSDAKDISRFVSSAVTNGARKRKHLATLIDAYEHLFSAQLENDRYAAALGTLRRITRLAVVAGLPERGLAAKAEMGTCFQLMGRSNDSIRCFAEVAKEAESSGYTSLHCSSLHNLAECLFASKRMEESVVAFQKCQLVAVTQGDILSSIQAAHGESLALESLERYTEALNGFRRCKKQALGVGCDSEYLRACEGVANTYWTQGKYRTAVDQMSFTISECKRLQFHSPLPHLVTSLCQLLRLSERNAEARRLLLKHRAIFTPDDWDSVDFHTHLAELSEMFEDFEKAEICWAVAVRLASSSGDEDHKVYCMEKLSRLARRKDIAMLSTRDLELRVEQCKNISDRVQTTNMLIQKLLSRRSKKRAEQLIEEMQGVMAANRLWAPYIDLLMMVFDYNWNGDRKSRLAALQAYAASCLAGLADSDPEKVGSIIAHVTETISARKTAPSLHQLAWLRRKFEEWWCAQEFKSKSLTRMLLAPILYAEQMIPVNTRPSKVAEQCETVWKGIADSV